MNDEPLDDEENDTHIRALLAELGSGPDGEPMPAVVAARLEDTLARLVAERGLSGPEDSQEEEGSGTVVPLRRRWLPRATAAAAAVVVLGAGGVAATQLGVFGHDSLTTADSAGSSSTAESETAPHPESTAPSPSGGDTGRGFQAAELPRLSSVSFAADVGRLLSSRPAQPTTPEKAAVPSANDAGRSPSDDTTAGKSSDALRSPACPGPRITDGAAPSPVQLDGRRAVLLVHPADNGHQLVEAWDCSGRRRLAETTLTP